MVLGCMTWREMCLSGVGIGMERLMDNRQIPIQLALQAEAFASYAAAVGTTIAAYAACAFRSTYDPVNDEDFIGFRCVRRVLTRPV